MTWWIVLLFVLGGLAFIFICAAIWVCSWALAGSLTAEILVREQAKRDADSVDNDSP